MTVKQLREATAGLPDDMDAVMLDSDGYVSVVTCAKPEPRTGFSYIDGLPGDAATRDVFVIS